MDFLYEIIIGIVIASICVWAVRKLYKRSGIGFWSFGLLVAALIYVGFAAFGKHTHGLMHEGLGVVFYSFFIFLSRKHGLWLLALGWLLHMGWDMFHGPFFMHTGYVPDWYPGVCAGFDLVIAAYIGYEFLQKRNT